jgi:phage terminase large subunit-like protein
VTDAQQFTTLQYRTKLRNLARLICKKGHDTMREHMHILMATKDINKFYRLDFFKPYAYQHRWFASGALCLLRYLSAANQIGKTYGAAHEFAYHATRLYPDWWKGFRCGAGTLWAIGISADSTRKVLQKELIGTNDARNTAEFGTGTIPRELINWDSIVRRGESLISLRVHHASGVESEIHFYSATQENAVYMGQKIVFAWIDEQSEKELEIIAQCTARTINTGGCIAVTATPEIGITDFYAQCKDDKTGLIHFQNATWNDADHLTQEVKDSLLARIPYYQRKMRSEGIPVLGVGAIYPYDTDQITCAPFTIPDHWIVLAAVDFGYSGIADLSVISFIAYDQETGTRYLFDEWSNEDDRDTYANSHLPDYMACKLLGQQPVDWVAATGGFPATFEGMGLPSIAVKLPNDGDGVQPGTQKTRGELMRVTGANVCLDTFEIPPDMAPLEKNRKSLIGSISVLGQWFQDGNLKIFNTCTETLREFRLYQWKKRGVRTVPADKDNHYLDALRYGAICVRDDGVSMYEARKNPDTGVYEIDNPYDHDMGAFKL